MAETLKQTPYSIFAFDNEDGHLLGCIGYREQGEEIDIGCIIAARHSPFGTGKKMLSRFVKMIHNGRRCVIGSHVENEDIRRCAIACGFTEVSPGRYEWQKG